MQASEIIATYFHERSGIGSPAGRFSATGYAGGLLAHHTEADALRIAREFAIPVPEPRPGFREDVIRVLEGISA